MAISISIMSYRLFWGYFLVRIYIDEDHKFQNETVYNQIWNKYQMSNSQVHFSDQWLKYLL